MVEFDLLSAGISSKVIYNIRPQYSKGSQFCTALTAIIPGELEGEKNLFEACDKIKEEFPRLENLTWSSYSDYDRKRFRKMSELHKRPYFFGMTHIDIKNPFASKCRLKKEVGMKKILKILNKELVGRHHNALDDALNITETLRAWLGKKVIA